jgi:hypothetical protein
LFHGSPILFDIFAYILARFKTLGLMQINPYSGQFLTFGSASITAASVVIELCWPKASPTIAEGCARVVNAIANHRRWRFFGFRPLRLQQEKAPIDCSIGAAGSAPCEAMAHVKREGRDGLACATPWF